jgi:transposase
LGLELTDPGFDSTVLSEFRTRLVAGQAESRLFDCLLLLCKERGWLKARGRQRTDSTHVLAAIHALNRLECVGETLRHALNALARLAPDWLSEHIPPDWLDRYGKRFENYRLPREEEKRKALAVTAGVDGSHLLCALWSEGAPAELRRLPAIETLRRVWVQQYTVDEGHLLWRDTKDLPPASLLINSPYDVEARFSIKRDVKWTGYKTHLTESCDEDLPHLITHVETTPGTTQDSDVTADIHADLAQAELLPAEHLTDEGFIDAELLVASQQTYGIELFGPVARDGSWQAVAGQGYDSAQFRVDWQAKQVICPQGKRSRKWQPFRDEWANEMIHIEFARADCLSCASRALCTRSKSGAREMGVRPQPLYLALRMARERQQTAEFQERYAARAGIEGTLSQGVHTCQLRRSRYIGLAKTRLQSLLIATSLNVLRLVCWLLEVPRAKTRPSPLAVLKSSRSQLAAAGV